MEDLYSLFTLGLMFLSILHTEARCKFPREWKGKWYQGGLGEVVIRSNKITQKGKCVEYNDDGFYLVENKEKECYMCLLLLPQHENIIQYKESYCVEKNTLDQICDQIRRRVELPLYTLVREGGGVPGECPFKDAYYFDYNDNSHGFCDTGISYAKPCAGPSMFKFHFKHCIDVTYLNGEDLDFNCIATWKAGSDMYLYGKFAGPAIATKDESYRCFMYEMFGNKVYMSMSADTTCRGLRSSQDGPLVMKFTRDLHGWPQPSCRFPQWMTSHENWRDMESRYLYQIDLRDRETLTVSKRRYPTSREHTEYTLRCVDILEQEETPPLRRTKIISFTSHNCIAKYQCVTIYEKAPDLVEILLGELTDVDDARRCRSNDVDKAHMIIPSQIPGIDCPYPGRHLLLYSTDDCSEDVQIGCNTTNTMAIPCTREGQVLPVVQCLTKWTEQNVTYVVVKTAWDDDSPAGCVRFEEKSDILELSTRCGRTVPNVLPNELSVTIQKTPDICEKEEPKVYVPVSLPDVVVDETYTDEHVELPPAVDDGHITEQKHEYRDISEVDIANTHGSQYQHVGRTVRIKGDNVVPERTTLAAVYAPAEPSHNRGHSAAVTRAPCLLRILVFSSLILLLRR